MKDTSSPDLRLSPVSIRHGVWEGVLSGTVEPGKTPSIDVHHLGEKVAEADISPTGQGTWTVRTPIQVDTLQDGVQTYSLVDQASGLLLASFAVSLGEALESDLRADVELLRAELDLLKRAFRRHCAEN